MGKQLLLICFLLWGAWWDLKTRTFPAVGLALFALAGLFAQIMVRDRGIWDIIGGAALGAVLLAASFLYPEGIGEGDGLFVFVTGIFLGFWDNLALLFFGLLLALAVGLVCAAFGQKLRDIRLPLAPFLLLVGLGMFLL